MTELQAAELIRVMKVIGSYVIVIMATVFTIAWKLYESKKP